MTKVFAVVAFAVLLAGCGGPATVKTEDAAAELKPLVQKQLAAWESLDPTKAAPFYAKDAGLAFYDFSPLKYTGWQEFEAGAKKTLADCRSAKFAMGSDFKATKSEGVAWVTYTFSYEIAMKSGETTKGEGRDTSLFEMRDGKWVIVHEHVSAPLPPPPPPPPAPAKAKAAKKARRK